MDYRVKFIKVERELDDKGKVIGRKDSYIGHLIISDDNTSNDSPLAAKAFRHCPEIFLLADKLVFERVK